MLVRFWKSTSGATLVEYGVALLMAIVLGGGGLAVMSDQTSANMQAAEVQLAAR